MATHRAADRPHHRLRNRAAMDRYILPALGKLPVRQVDAAALDAFYATCGPAAAKTASADVAPSSVSASYARALVAQFQAQPPAPTAMGGQRLSRLLEVDEAVS